MGKYREVAKTSIKTQLVWRADVIFNMIFTITKILFAHLLWGIVFKNKETIGGFTFHGMLSYYIISSFLSQLEMSKRVSGELHAKIRNGAFSKYIVIPVGIQKYFMAMQLGAVMFYIGFDFIAAVVWIFIFQIEFVVVTNWFIIVCAVMMTILGMAFMVQLNYFLGLLALKYQGIGTFLMIKNNLVALATGSIIPLALFPEMLVNIMKIFPFYYVTYLPSMLLVGMYQEEAVYGVIVISCWCAIIQFFIDIVWKKYVKKYDGVGI